MATFHKKKDQVSIVCTLNTTILNKFKLVWLSVAFVCLTLRQISCNFRGHHFVLCPISYIHRRDGIIIRISLNNGIILGSVELRLTPLSCSALVVVKTSRIFCLANNVCTYPLCYKISPRPQCPIAVTLCYIPEKLRISHIFITCDDILYP